MVRFAKITVVLLEGTAVQFSNTTLLDVAKACLSHPLANENPLLIKIAGQYNLFVKTAIFKDWIEQKIEIQELVDELKVDNLARNQNTIIVENVEVEDDSLWLVKNNHCILADADTFVCEKLDNRFKLV